jgi:hypothetical protein
MHFAEQVALAKHMVLFAIQANLGRTTFITIPLQSLFSV